MTTRREIIEDVRVLQKKTEILEKEVEKNTERIFTHIHPMEGGGWTGTATTTTNTATSYVTFYGVS